MIQFLFFPLESRQCKNFHQTHCYITQSAPNTCSALTRLNSDLAIKALWIKKIQFPFHLFIMHLFWSLCISNVQSKHQCGIFWWQMKMYNDCSVPQFSVFSNLSEAGIYQHQIQIGIGHKIIWVSEILPRMAKIHSVALWSDCSLLFVHERHLTRPIVT